MPHRVCPWWIGYLLASPLRRFSQDPAAILAPYIRDGMTVLEPGPGMGFFTLEMARLVGPSGRVVAVDIQPKMLSVLRRRLSKRGLGARLDARLVGADSLAFAVVHELPSAELFFGEVAGALRSGGSVLVAEPRGHVKLPAFEAELKAAEAAGLRMAGSPSIPRSHAALLTKS